ncbi:FAD-dependent oxidoreductase [Candidatus Saccharibacteria bacterium]|jgi:thioredoxin reductase (NADPH)|nr:FAD-dependent oxidoreductase [Candidatus Saccharibacteria bacterium]HPR09500.1 FAD-dependent oxidoreductase [Candidatus Saccharibacteria bacterium]
MAERTEENSHQVIMIGAGPAALSAAIYTTREDIDTLLLEKAIPGGLAAVTDQVDNYPGFPDGVAGLELANNLQQQAERFGAAIEPTEVTALHDEGEWKRIETITGDYYAKVVLIATGSAYKKLGVAGEEEYYARGVHYCATCDGAFYRDKRIAVVGGGNSAVQEAMFLTRFSSHLDLIVRSKLRASEILQKELQKFVDEGKITVHLGVTTDEIVGQEGKVTMVKGTDTETGNEVTIDTDGVFVFIGLSPNNQFAGDQFQTDEVGLIKSDANLMTNVPGIFVAGDIRSGATMQIASAVGEGATAALKIREYLEGHPIDVQAEV